MPASSCQGRLPGAGRADDGDPLPGPYREVDPFEDGVPGHVLETDSLDVDGGGAPADDRR